MQNEQSGGLPRNKLFPEEFVNQADAWRDYNSSNRYYDNSAIPVYSTPLIQPSVVYSRISQREYDLDNDNNYLVQSQITKDLRNKFINRWLLNDYPELLKYVKKSKDEDSKVDYIKEEILTLDKARKILIKIMYETDLKWYDLPYFENIVKKTFAHYIKKKLKHE